MREGGDPGLCGSLPSWGSPAGGDGDSLPISARDRSRALRAKNCFEQDGGAGAVDFSLSGASLGQIGKNYSEVFEQARLLSSLRNSLLITICSVALIILLSSLSAYVVVQRRTRPMRVLHNLILAGLTLPVAMVPTFYMLNQVGLAGGTGAIFGSVLVYTATNFAFAHFLYAGYIAGIPTALDEAAIVDGLSPLRLYCSVILPLMQPATVAVIIVEVMSVWNDFTIALYLLNDSKRTTAVLTTYIFMGQKSSEWNLLFADVVFVSLPMVVCFLFLQKYIVAGLTAGAVKG